MSGFFGRTGQAAHCDQRAAAFAIGPSVVNGRKKVIRVVSTHDVHKRLVQDRVACASSATPATTDRLDQRNSRCLAVDRCLYEGPSRIQCSCLRDDNVGVGDLAALIAI